MFNENSITHPKLICHQLFLPIDQLWLIFVKFNNKEKDQTSELQALIAANQEAIQQIYPNEQPLLVIFYEDGAQQELKILEAVIRLLWGDALDIRTNKLPASTHGPKAELPEKDLKPAERAKERRKAWEPIAKHIAKLNRRTFCLVVAREFYSDPNNNNASKHDGMQDTWQGARIIRIRQDLAPNIIEDKILSLAQTFIEDTRKKEYLPVDISLPTPSSQINNLFRLEPTSQSGCVTYLSLRHDGITRKKRGLSCYRKTTVTKQVKINKAILFFWCKFYQEIQSNQIGEAGLDIWFIKLMHHLVSERTNSKWQAVCNQAGYKFHALETLQPYVDKWSNPNPLEIVVTLRQEGDNPDHLAALVESLRCGFGHYSGWTTLPALLFFERVVRDYISAFALQDEEAESELESED